MENKKQNPWLFAGLGIMILGALAWSLKQTNKGSRVAPPTVVPTLTPERFAGTWYEVARLPNSWQKFDDIGNSNTYSLKPDGQFEVLQSWFPRHFENPPKQIKSRLWLPDSATPGKMKLQSNKSPSRELWILALDPQYRFVIMGTPDRKSAWIMSPTPSLDQELLDQALTLLESKGYSLQNIMRVPQLPVRV